MEEPLIYIKESELTNVLYHIFKKRGKNYTASYAKNLARAVFKSVKERTEAGVYQDEVL